MSSYKTFWCHLQRKRGLMIQLHHFEITIFNHQSYQKVTYKKNNNNKLKRQKISGYSHMTVPYSIRNHPTLRTPPKTRTSSGSVTSSECSPKAQEPPERESTSGDEEVFRFCHRDSSSERQCSWSSSSSLSFCPTAPMQLVSSFNLEERNGFQLITAVTKCYM